MAGRSRTEEKVAILLWEVLWNSVCIPYSHCVEVSLLGCCLMYRKRNDVCYYCMLSDYAIVLAIYIHGVLFLTDHIIWLIWFICDQKDLHSKTESKTDNQSQKTLQVVVVQKQYTVPEWQQNKWMKHDFDIMMEIRTNNKRDKGWVSQSNQ